MIEVPDFSKPFFYENNFYLSCDVTRISKILAQYELFKMILDIPGEIVECGVFKGCSLIRFAIFRELFTNIYAKRVIGFDVFGKFPETKNEKIRQSFIDNAGNEGIDIKQLITVFKKKGIYKNIELVRGDIKKTVPRYVKKHPELKISLLNLDTDVYEPAVTILENFWDKMSPNGIILLDDYSVYHGEMEAVDEFFKDKNIVIKKLPFCISPCYIIK